MNNNEHDGHDPLDFDPLDFEALDPNDLPDDDPLKKDIVEFSNAAPKNITFTRLEMKVMRHGSDASFTYIRAMDILMLLVGTLRGQQDKTFTTTMFGNILGRTGSSANDGIHILRLLQRMGYIAPSNISQAQFLADPQGAPLATITMDGEAGADSWLMDGFDRGKQMLMRSSRCIDLTGI